MTRTGKKRQRRMIPRLRLAALLLAAILGVLLFSQTAFARTYVITDGDRVVTYTTFATDPAQVLGQAGMELGAYDTYTTEAVEGGSAITIRRAQEITIKYHGEVMQTTSSGETVGELLSRLNLVVSGEDVVSHGMDDSTCDDMVLLVDRMVTVQETYTVTMPHQVSYCNDASLPEGTQEVLVGGVDGELLCTAEVSYLNGEEVDRQVLSQNVIRAAVTEIVGQGTGETSEAESDMPVIEDGYIRLPTGEVLTYTDTATIRATAYTHTDAGCDFITATGTTVHRGTVAVDPRYIPYGTRMFIVSNDGEYVYGISVAEDCGGDIKGDRMDLYFPTYDECIQFGRRVCTIYFLG